MSEYLSCSMYGRPECCSVIIDEYKTRVEGFSVKLTYSNRSIQNIHPWYIREVINHGNNWFINRQNTAEYLAVDTTSLTPESRITYAKHHHWDTFTIHKLQNCPL